MFWIEWDSKVERKYNTKTIFYIKVVILCQLSCKRRTYITSIEIILTILINSNYR